MNLSNLDILEAVEHSPEIHPASIVQLEITRGDSLRRAPDFAPFSSVNTAVVSGQAAAERLIHVLSR